MTINENNYYSQEADQAFFSASQIKSFLDCPARTVAQIRGEYKPEQTTALLVGSYVDSYFAGEDAAVHFEQTHPEIFNKRTGELKADFVHALRMIDRAKSDEVFMSYLTGDSQHIVTGEIFSYPFKAKFDFYVPGKCIVDLKTVRDLKPVYKPGEGRLNYAQAWNWPLQMAIYQALEGNRLPCYLAVITKEDPPTLDLVQIPQEELDAELEWLKLKMPLFDAYKQGYIDPERCEDCAYCRASKKITGPRILRDLMEEEV